MQTDFGQPFLLPPAHSGVHSMNLSHYANKPICQLPRVIQGRRMKNSLQIFFRLIKIQTLVNLTIRNLYYCIIVLAITTTLNPNQTYLILCSAIWIFVHGIYMSELIHSNRLVVARQQLQVQIDYVSNKPHATERLHRYQFTDDAQEKLHDQCSNNLKDIQMENNINNKMHKLCITFDHRYSLLHFLIA